MDTRASLSCPTPSFVSPTAFHRSVNEFTLPILWYCMEEAMFFFAVSFDIFGSDLNSSNLFCSVCPSS